MSAPAIKVLEGKKDRRCPACRRHDVRPGRRHKRALGHDAPWCPGTPTEQDKQRQRAMDLLMKVYDLYSRGFDLTWGTKDHGPAIAFCRQVLDACEKAGIETGRNKASDQLRLTCNRVTERSLTAAGDGGRSVEPAQGLRACDKEVD